ncbi:hypothetical protein C8Q75DRAFT_808854 [Abortiporus biennis]|nr:hypothetical protein C8Q75DRAFT_808854 [Abortiporus biennis]
MTEDEYDTLPDPFEGLDWNTIPELAEPPRSTGEEPPTSQLLSNTPHSSSDYAFDDVDDAFLAEVSAIETAMTVPRTPSPHPMRAYSSSVQSHSYNLAIPQPQRSTGFSSASHMQMPSSLASIPDASSQKRKLSPSETESSEAHAYKGKERASDGSQPKHPTCVVCRAGLTSKDLMVPNIALDNTVEKQIEALATHGDKSWVEDGPNYQEWKNRRDKGKRDAAIRAEKGKLSDKTVRVARAVNPNNVNTGPVVIDDDPSDEDYRPAGLEEDRLEENEVEVEIEGKDSTEDEIITIAPDITMKELVASTTTGTIGETVPGSLPE